VFLALLALLTFVTGLSRAAGPTTGLIASSSVAMMLVTVTLPTSVAQAAVHDALHETSDGAKRPPEPR